MTSPSNTISNSNLPGLISSINSQLNSSTILNVIGQVSAGKDIELPVRLLSPKENYQGFVEFKYVDSSMDLAVSRQISDKDSSALTITLGIFASPTSPTKWAVRKLKVVLVNDPELNSITFTLDNYGNVNDVGMSLKQSVIWWQDI